MTVASKTQFVQNVQIFNELDNKIHTDCIVKVLTEFLNLTIIENYILLICNSMHAEIICDAH